MMDSFKTIKISSKMIQIIKSVNLLCKAQMQFIKLPSNRNTKMI